MRRSLLLITLAILLVSSGCGYKSNQIVLAGSTAFQPFAEKLAEIYMKEHPGTSIDVQGGGSAVGVMAALQGIVNIGMADMLKLPKEADPLKKIVVARDGIAIVVNPRNRISELTFEQAQQIFCGEIDNWEKVGGRPAEVGRQSKAGKIRVISREEGSGTRKSFDKLVLGKKRLTRHAMFQDSNGTIREAVKSDPDSIGYISIGFLTPDVKDIKLDGVVPSNENVVAGKYKIARPVYFLLQAEPQGLTKQFIDFILSKRAQQIMATDGLIPVN